MRTKYKQGPMRARFRRIWRHATPEQKQAGAAWYDNARTTCETLASESGLSFEACAGIVSALSPRLHWVRNVAVARKCAMGIKVTGVFRHNLAKAQRIRAGEHPLDALSGPKTRAFYRAIIGDAHSAVIDAWMVRAAGFDPERETLKSTQYAHFERALVHVATELGIPASHVQATIWIAERGRAE